MSNNTSEYWSVQGVDGQEVSLHQWGWSVTTVGGSRYDLPPRRGSDITLAYRPGQLNRRKLPDARQITLVMFMVGWDPATGNAPPDQRLQWNDNWDELRRLVYRHQLLAEQRTRLYRRWFLTSPTFPATRSGDNIIASDPGVPAPGPQLVTAFAYAEMTGNMAPAMTGRFRSDFQLDFTLAEPFFYGAAPVNVTVNKGTPAYVWNDGHDVACSGYVAVNLYGPLVNPVVTNLSTNPAHWVKYNGTIAAGENIRLQVNRFACERIKSNGVDNVIGKLSNYGARFWLNILPGGNKLQLTADSGSGHASVTFYPPYV